MYSEHYHEYMQEQALEDLYEEFKEQAIEEFTSERLRSYYLANPLLAKPALDSLAEARNLITVNPTASLIFSNIAIEVGLKATLLKPIVYGLVHTDSIADLIADLTVSRTGKDRYRTLLFRILKVHGKVDLADYKRRKSNRTLWEEIAPVQKLRNAVLHRAEKVSRSDADLSLCVGSDILEHIFPSVLKAMDLHLHDGYRICDSWRCRFPEIKGVVVDGE